MKRPTFPREKRWLYLSLGFVLGVLFFWGLNTWLNSRPEKPAKPQVKERPIVSGKSGYNPYEGTRVRNTAARVMTITGDMEITGKMM